MSTLNAACLLAGLLIAAGTILRALWRTARALDRHMTAVQANTRATADLSAQFVTHTTTTANALDQLTERVRRLEHST